MLPQEELIARVRAISAADERLDALMMYGSFTRGEGDAYSDIEFLLFFEDEAFEQIGPRAWLEQIAPVLLDYTNEYGIIDVIFDNFVRGEFHFHRVSEMRIAEAWRGVIAFPSLESTLLLDKSGRFAPFLTPIIGPPPERATEQTLSTVTRHFANIWLFGYQVLQRGEYARAMELLNSVHRELLHMARAVESTTDNWLTPSKSVEHDLSPAAYERFRACTAPLEPEAQRRAFAESWTWGKELLAVIEAQYGVALSPQLLARFDAVVAGRK